MKYLAATSNRILNLNLRSEALTVEFYKELAEKPWRKARKSPAPATE